MQLTCMINWLNSTLKSINTSSTTHNACTRLACMWKLRKSHSRSKTRSMRTGFSNCKLLSSTNLKKLLMLSHSSNRCLLIHQKLSLLKVVCYTKKKSTKKPEQSSKRLWIKPATSAISPITSHSATTRWNSWLHPWGTLLTSLRKAWEKFLEIFILY